MRNIEQILEEEGISLSDEQKKRINASVSENYRTVADYKKQVKKIEDARKKIEDFQVGRTGTATKEKHEFDMTIHIKDLDDLEYLLNLIRR